MSQFDGISSQQYRRVPILFVDTKAKLRQAITLINKAGQHDEKLPIVFASLVNREFRELLTTANTAIIIDPFAAFIGPLSEVLQLTPKSVVGLSHGVGEADKYDSRVDAVNFTLATDDGSCPDRCAQADLILVGVSRSGKTPTSLYLAIHYGLYVANYPLTEEDLMGEGLPKPLQPYRGRLFGLNISPERLHNVRERRKPGSRYALLETCRQEINRAKAIFVAERIPSLDTTLVSIEEISAAILQKTGITPRHV